MSDRYIPRFGFEITEEQRERAVKVFGHYGMRKAIFSRILDEVMDMIEEHGHIVEAVLLDKTTSIRKVIPSLAKAERAANILKEVK